ncbi:MAG TPA: dihydrolipoyl dehydrogenase [Candidatus Polarisedimenticolia bacterium]|nr:dihydrolipoyl dehydrogenase [Candidatus Polarisedimenticolia bacterium]
MAGPQESGGRFDLVVIGAGPGGYIGAIRASQLGLRTALIEKDAELGGTCLLRGCIPTKALLQSAAMHHTLQHAGEFGFKISGVQLDFPAVQKRKAAIVERLSKGVAFLMKKNRVQVFEGTGKIDGPFRVSVASRSGRSQILEAKNILLATGSEAKGLPGIEPDGKKILTSDHALELSAVPKSIIILGAGAVGVEFASIFSSFGTQVTVVELLPRAVPGEDEEISKELERCFKKRGITVRTGVKVQKASPSAKGVEVILTSGEGGKPETLSAEFLLLGVGRRPKSDGLGLEKTKVIVEKGFVRTDAVYRTAEPGLWAIGDLVGRAPLAHVASHEAVAAAEAMAGGEPHPINYDQVPWCTYCDPEVARVGLTEKQAQERGHSVKSGKFPFSVLGRAQILGETEGFVKIVTDQKYGEVLGVHIIGPKATELVAEGAALLALEATTESIVATLHAHPSLSEAVGEAALDVLGRALNR